ncbi:ester cyclase [Paraburkholderia nemoris]
MLGLTSPFASAECHGSRESNARSVALTFQEDFFNRHELAAGWRFLSSDYRQHNPNLPEGREPFIEFFSSYFSEHPEAHASVIRSAVDGDLVYVHVLFRSAPSDRGRAVVNIYRIRGKQIVEHWDVVQPVPAESRNANTMF